MCAAWPALWGSTAPENPGMFALAAAGLGEDFVVSDGADEAEPPPDEPQAEVAASAAMEMIVRKRIPVCSCTTAE